MQPPHMLLALSDGPRALVDAACLQMLSVLLRKLPRTDRKHSVMVLPGFLSDDRGNGPLIRYLRHLGYTATGWRQGRNLGPESFTDESLTSAMEPLLEAGGGKVSLVGHSLGGIYARDDDDSLNTPPPVPTTAIYTKADGVVNWRTSLQQGDDHDVHNIEVAGSHIGLNLNAAVWFWIARKLAEV